MRFIALQLIQAILALINIWSPVVQLSWFTIFVDPAPFYFFLYHQPHNHVMDDHLVSSMPIQPGVTFEDMKKLVSLAY